MLSTEIQPAHDHPHLDPSIFKAAQEAPAKLQPIDARAQLREQLQSQFEVHRATVVRVYQAEIPQFRALIDVGIAGRG